MSTITKQDIGEMAATLGETWKGILISADAAAQSGG